MAISLRDMERAQRAGELMELAALSCGGLRTVFDQVADRLDAEMLQMFNFTRPEAPDMIVAPSRTQIYADYMSTGWHEHDTWSHLAAKIAKHGRILTDDSVTTPDERRRDMFYQDFCPKWRIGNFTAWTFDMSGERWAFTLMGRPEAEHARPNEKVYRRFIEASDRASLLAAGRDTLIGQGDADYHFGQLARHASSSLRTQLRNFLIRRLDGRRPILAMPVHVRDRGLHGLPGARIIVMFADLDAASNADAKMIGAAFDLTPREAQFVARLLAGDTVQAAGNAMNVSIQTARQMLKSVFSKTNTHRQAELIALLQRARFS